MWRGIGSYSGKNNERNGLLVIETSVLIHYLKQKFHFSRKFSVPKTGSVILEAFPIIKIARRVQAFPLRKCSLHITITILLIAPLNDQPCWGTTDMPIIPVSKREHFNVYNEKNNELKKDFVSHRHP